MLDMSKLMPRCHVIVFTKIKCLLLILDYTCECACLCACVWTLIFSEENGYIFSLCSGYLYQSSKKNIQNFNVRIWKTPSCRTLGYLYKEPATMAPTQDSYFPLPADPSKLLTLQNYLFQFPFCPIKTCISPKWLFSA